MVAKLQSCSSIHSQNNFILIRHNFQLIKDDHMLLKTFNKSTDQSIISTAIASGTTGKNSGGLKLIIKYCHK
jgi:hypothetical protein